MKYSCKAFLRSESDNSLEIGKNPRLLLAEEKSQLVSFEDILDLDFWLLEEWFVGDGNEGTACAGLPTTVWLEVHEASALLAVDPEDRK